MTAETLLNVENLHAWYDESHILHGIGLEIKKGELITLLGRNGAGKSTTLKSIMGIVRRRSGSIKVNGRETIRSRTRDIARLGVAFCPEERAIFASLSVEENLTLPPILKEGGLSIPEIHAQFPNLRERARAGGANLSGGEQQMLAIARILRTGASVFLLDEPTEGLAPVIVHKIRDTIRALKRDGYTIILVEQNIKFASELADRNYVIENGSVVDKLEKSDGSVDQIKYLEKYLKV